MGSATATEMAAQTQALDNANHAAQLGHILHRVITENLTKQQWAKLVLVKFSFVKGAAVALFRERNNMENTDTTVFKIPCMFMGKEVSLSLCIATEDAVQNHEIGVEVRVDETITQFVEAMKIMGVHL